MTNTQPITFTYIHCSRTDIEAHEASFDEDAYIQKIQSALPDLNITSVKVEVISTPSHTTSLYTVRILITSPAKQMTEEKSGSDPAKVMRAAIQSALNRIHDLKDKVLSHHRHNYFETTG